MPAPPCLASPSDLEHEERLAPAESARWFKEKVQAHDSQLKAYLRGKFPSVRDVEDVVQDSYIRVWQRHVRQPIASVKAFLFTVARHAALDRLRSDSNAPFAHVAEGDILAVSQPATSIPEAACLAEETAVLLDAIARLPQRTREIYLLRKFEGLSQREIAERLGLSIRTVEVLIGRANRACERYLRVRGIIRDSAP